MKKTAATIGTLLAISALTIRRRSYASVLLSIALLAFASPFSPSQGLQLGPHLYSGQTLIYRIDFSSSRNIKTESRVTSPQFPPAESLTTSALLQVEIIEATATGVRLKTYYSEREPAPSASKSSAAESAAASPVDKMIEVTLASNGTTSQIKGFDQLSAAQQFAWNDWLGRFTSCMTYPKGPVHPGQRWESSEPETTPSPIAGLAWSKKSQYVRDERCTTFAEAPKSSADKSSSDPETCAVILVRATLRQKVSPKNTTPGDYKLHNLKTRGTASGENETILYVSRSSGLLVRSTEDARQAMDVWVELADRSNQVHYTLDAKSRSEIMLLPESRQDVH